jgi:hypothetical protein
VIQIEWCVAQTITQLDYTSCALHSTDWLVPHSGLRTSPHNLYLRQVLLHAGWLFRVVHLSIAEQYKTDFCRNQSRIKNFGAAAGADGPGAASGGYGVWVGILDDGLGGAHGPGNTGARSK